MLLHMRYNEKRDAVLRALANAHGAAKQRFLVPLEHDRRTLARMVAEGAVTRHPQHVIALPGTGLFAFEGVVGGAYRILRRLPSGGP